MHNQQEQQHLGIVGSLLMRMFGQPKGVLGQLGGFILARANTSRLRFKRNGIKIRCRVTSFVSL